jgi:vacuolar-type H+-ATPase subunit I/STV1
MFQSNTSSITSHNSDKALRPNLLNLLFFLGLLHLCFSGFEGLRMGARREGAAAGAVT